MPSPATRALSLLALLLVAPTTPASDTAPGVVAQYHALPDGFVPGAPLPAPLYVEILDDFAIDVGETVGGSPFTHDVSVRLVGNFDLPFDETYSFFAKGGESRELRVDGQLVSGPVALSAGSHALDARFSLVDVDEGLPLFCAASVGGILPVALVGGAFSHDLADELPAIHALPASGSAHGGQTITLEGFGFTPPDDVVVHFGNTTITAADGALVTPDAIVLISPPHVPGDVFVRVQTPRGVSNERVFSYTATGVPPTPEFEVSEESVTVEAPIAAAWGHDGNLYVGLRSGHVAEITFDDGLVPTDTTIHDGVSQLEHVEILGLTTSPFETSGEVALYVSHTTLYAYGAGSWFGEAPYIGAVSVLRGPSFDKAEPLITGLPTSNQNHGPNALLFDDNGDLLIACGGSTNAGIQAGGMGGISESPLSGAVLKARTSDPGFDGTVEYLLSATGAPVDDQQLGFESVVVPGDVVVHAPGLRNSFDLTLATNGYLYATDNGPNIGWGPALLGEGVLGPEVAGPDEVLLVEAGNYYGHPNIARAVDDPAQYTFRDTLGASIPETFTQALTIVDSSTNGILEYRANTFWGQWRGDLLVQRFNGLLSRLDLSDDGRHVVDVQPVFPPSGGLNVLSAPGGAVLSLAYSGGVVRALEPVPDGAPGVLALDIHPWRAPASGGARFVIGGRGFTTLADTQVSFGDTPAALTKVTPTRIEGVVPVLPDAGAELLDVAVVSGAERSALEAAFRALPPIGTAPGRWLPTAPMPVALSDVATAVIDATLYVVGFGHPATLTLDLYTGEWSQTTAAPRPIVARGQAACALDGKLYVVGGTGAPSAGRLQVYDPSTDLWSLGADLPWPGGSLAVAPIEDRIYAVGGVLAGQTTDRCASYDPDADAWTSRAPMPLPRHFASAGVLDGRLWLFGGWSDTPFGFTSDHAELQVYDPAQDAWFQSDVAPGLVEMPLGRGRMGRAVFWQGEFYLFGGALKTDTLSFVLDRVDAYDPATGTWREDAALPTARQGIAPALFEGRTFVVGGSEVFAVVPTTAAETFTRQ